MENQDKIFEQFKSAAESVETKDFSGMEKVWNRVEEKLDNKENKKAMLLWKKIAVAACLLLIGTVGFQFLKNNQPEIKPNETIVAKDSVKAIIPNENAVVNVAPVNPAIKKEAEQILQKQIMAAPQVAALELKTEDVITSDTIFNNRMGYSAKAAAPSVSALKDNSEAEAKKEKFSNVEMFMDKSTQVSPTKKDEPLVILNNKLEKKSIKNLEFDEDSLVVLKEPLYIINGVEYTEQEVFGPNPTSPYSPLKKQEIETISILQDEKAIEIYGDKGKKGVVIITTKNGKPVSASKKAK